MLSGPCAGQRKPHSMPCREPLAAELTHHPLSQCVDGRELLRIFLRQGHNSSYSAPLRLFTIIEKQEHGLQLTFLQSVLPGKGEEPS